MKNAKNHEKMQRMTRKWEIFMNLKDLLISFVV